MRPRLWVNDVGLGSEDNPPGPWETALSVLPGITPTAPALLAEADVVLMQRLNAEDAEVCATVLRLPEGMETRLRQLHDGMLMTVVGGAPKFISLATTPIEEEILGPPRRD
jgi:ESX secretion system protein EccE